ncbi:sugar phosphate nucleotidyltransferase [Nocardiopsis mwathae]|nr:sugar phosphate nucleotidyltransferase [Nocardiopsis mwathae]
MIAAGGLGTRRANWSRFLPKEYFPVQGKPGIALLMEEIAELGKVRAVMVHHPYYSQFAAWATRVLNMPSDYDHVAGTAPEAQRWPGVSLELIAQSGPYGDITSVLNADDHLSHPDDLYVMYADNLYPRAQPVMHLSGMEAGTAVIARPYTRSEAAQRGVIVCDSDRMIRLVEKPDDRAARALEARYRDRRQCSGL